MTIFRFVLPLLSVVAAFAFDAPDLNGVFKRGADDNSTTYTIQQQGPNFVLSVDSRLRGGRLGSSYSGSSRYTTDGVERVTKDAGREVWTTAYWQGESLVVQRIVKTGEQVSVTRDVWTLSGDRSLLTRARRTIDARGVAESSETFQRQ